MAQAPETGEAQPELSEAMVIHRNEARNARLRALADSINDTARMARNTMTAALVVALYLGVTLLSSTDLNLFLNGQVVLPQVGTGVSVVQSYIFAPPVFVFLHVQALFMLGVLARKVRAYNKALIEEEIPEERRKEYWNWLSAFAFVQLFRQDHALTHPSRILSWLSTNVVPLGLLFAVDVSFVRYQSVGITWSHHLLFIADLIFVAGFNWQVFRGGHLIWWDRTGAALWRMLRERRLVGFREISYWFGFVWIGAMQAVAVAMALILVYHAQPPWYDPAMDQGELRQFRSQIHRESSVPTQTPAANASPIDVQAETVWNTAMALWERIEAGDPNFNLLDAGPCEWWGAGCRYLDIQGQTLVEQTAEARFQLALKEVASDEITQLRRQHSVPLSVIGRNFRFANFSGVFAPGIDLHGADLRGSIAPAWPGNDDASDFTRANLKLAALDGANWSRALLDHATMTGISASKARFIRTSFKEAVLDCFDPYDTNEDGNRQCAGLQGVILTRAQLQGADLRGAQLQGAFLGGAQLQGVFLRTAQLQGVFLRTAQLQGVFLRTAKLQGADLRRAKLQGAFLAGAQLQGANLREAKLQGADLRSAELQGAFGDPVSWRLVALDGARFHFPALTDETDDGTSSKPAEAWLENFLTDEMRETKVSWAMDLSVANHIKDSVLRGVEEGLVAPTSSDLVTHTRDPTSPTEELTTEGWPESVDPKTSPDYYRELRKTFTEIACLDEHAARGLMWQWRKVSWPSRPDGPAKDAVHAAFAEARAADTPCRGLKAIPDDEWQNFIEGPLF